MKIFIAATVFLITLGLKAEDSKPKAQPSAMQTDETKRMTTKEAKKTCKEQGKTGDELIQCMKEKKESN